MPAALVYLYMRVASTGTQPGESFRFRSRGCIIPLLLGSSLSPRAI